MIHINDGDFLTIPVSVNQFRTIRIDDIFYIMSSRKNFILVTMVDGEFIENKYSNRTELWQYIMLKHNNFMEMDRDLLVNVDKIMQYDSFMNKVYASDKVNVQVNGVTMKRLKSKYTHLKDLSQMRNMDIEYAPRRSQTI